MFSLSKCFELPQLHLPTSGTQAAEWRARMDKINFAVSCFPLTVLRVSCLMFRAVKFISTESPVVYTFHFSWRLEIQWIDLAQKVDLRWLPSTTIKHGCFWPTLTEFRRQVLERKKTWHYLTVSRYMIVD